MSARSPASWLIASSVLLLGVSISSHVLADMILGQVASSHARVDGSQVPPGTTLLDPSRLSTGTEPAVVYLSNGQVLALGPNSSVDFEAAPDHRVQARLTTGSLAFRKQTGEIATLVGSNSLIFSQAGAQEQQDVPQGEVQEGVRVGERVEEEELVGMCHLIDWTPQKAELCHEDPELYFCQWELIEVPESEVEEHLELGDVIAGDNDLGLDDDCKEERLALVWWNQKEVTVAALLGALTAAYWIDQEREDPDRAPASPILP